MINLHIGVTGFLEWCKWNFIHHNKYGPSLITTSGMKQWFVDGYFHRVGGPAITNSAGIAQWWLAGVEYKSHLEYLVALSKYNND